MTQNRTSVMQDVGRATNPIAALCRANRRGAEMYDADYPSVDGRRQRWTLLKGACTHSGAYLLQALEELGWQLVRSDKGEEVERLRDTLQRTMHALLLCRDEVPADVWHDSPEDANAVEEALNDAQDLLGDGSLRPWEGF